MEQIKTNITILEKKRDKLKEKRDEQNNKLTSLKNQVNIIEEEIKNLELSLNESESQLENYESDIKINEESYIKLKTYTDNIVNILSQNVSQNVSDNNILELKNNDKETNNKKQVKFE